MLPAMIENHTDIIGAPPDWDRETHGGPCLGLPVRVEQNDGLRWLASAWRPSPDELAALNRGASVHLRVSAPQHPVVSMGVGPVPGQGPLCGFVYACVGVTPRWQEVEVWDDAKAQPLNRSIIEIHAGDGWARCYVLDAMGQGILNDDGSPKIECITGSFSLRWKAE